MRKPIKSSLYFEARFRVIGKVLQSIMCPHCEEEGELFLRVARTPDEDWKYDPKDATTFVDIVGFDTKKGYLQVRPGDWIEADVICFGHMKHARASRIEIEGNILTSGGRKIGRASMEENRLVVDFGVFKAALTAPTREEFERALKRQRIRHGTYVETDCSVDVELRAIAGRTTGQPIKGLRHRRRR